MKTIVIVLVNYKKEHELVAFAKTFLFSQEYKNLQLIIVDNGSVDNSILSEILPDTKISLVVSEQNVGYIGAAAVAFDYYMTNNGNQLPDYFIISNFDLSFDPIRFFDKLIMLLDESGVSVAGPHIVSSLNGASLNPMYKRRLTSSHLQRLIRVTNNYKVFFAYQLLHYAKRKLTAKSSGSYASVEDTYAVHGSMMILAKSFFEKGGTLKYDSFLYGEEIYIAEQCRELGLKTMVFHELKVTHHEHSTTGNIKNRMHMKFLNSSLKFLHSKYYND